jgi:hypothetical protein
MPVLVLWHRTNALYAPAFYSDAWFYTGFFHNFIEAKRDLFYGMYYGTRLGWLLPGSAVHALLPPIAANFVLRWLVFSVAAMSLFFAVRRLAGARAALPATLVFAVNPWVWAAIGWDYPDGAAIAYSLWLVALLTRAAATPSSPWWPAGAGAVLAALIYTHLFWISISPVFLLYAWALMRAWHGPLLWRRLARFALSLAAGFAALTILFSCINYAIDGNFWFYTGSIRRALYMARDFQFVREIVDENGTLVAWLWPAAAGAACALALLPLRLHNGASRTPAAIVSLLLLAPLAYMSWMQYRRNTVLAHHPYASDLLPFIFLVLGVAFWEPVSSLSRRSYLLLCGSAALVFGLLWLRPHAPPNGYFLAGWPLAQNIALAASLLLLAIAFILRRRLTGPVLACAGFACFTAFSQSHTAYLGGVDLHGDRDQYTRMMNARHRIEARRGGNMIRFWYNRFEPDWHEFSGINAMYISEFNRISEDFPAGCNDPVPPETIVVVMSSRSGVEEQARTTLNACWQRYGMYAAVEEITRFERPRNSYVLAILRAKTDRARWQPIRAVFDASGNGTLEPADSLAPLLRDRWTRLGGTLRVLPGGLAIRTPSGQTLTSVEYATLAAGFPGQYRFALRIRDRTGMLGFEARHAGKENSVGLDVRGVRRGDEIEMSFWKYFVRGEQIVLRVRNHDLGGRGAASCLLRDLTVTAVPDQE